jgi:hypothetical protein
MSEEIEIKNIFEKIHNILDDSGPHSKVDAKTNDELVKIIKKYKKDEIYERSIIAMKKHKDKYL